MIHLCVEPLWGPPHRACAIDKRTEGGGCCVCVWARLTMTRVRAWLGVSVNVLISYIISQSAPILSFKDGYGVSILLSLSGGNLSGKRIMANASVCAMCLRHCSD